MKVENFPLQKKKFFFAELQELEHSTEVQKFFFSKKCHPSRGILKVENFPLQKKKKFFAELQELEHSTEVQKIFFFRKMSS